MSCPKKYFNFCVRLFSNLTYSFVAIELLAFFINANSIFIAQESSLYLGLKITPYVKRIDFFVFCVYKKFLPKKLFAY